MASASRLLIHVFIFIKVNSLFRKTNCLLGTLDKGCTLFFIKEFNAQIGHPSGSRLLSFGLLKVEAPCLCSLVGYLRSSPPPDPSPERHAPVYTSPTGGGQMHSYAEMGMCFCCFTEMIESVERDQLISLYSLCVNLGVVVRGIAYQVLCKLFNDKYIAGILLFL